jgi:hypothetical protein
MPRRAEAWPKDKKDGQSVCQTNDCLKLRGAACYPFGKTSCFSQMDA